MKSKQNLALAVSLAFATSLQAAPLVNLHNEKPVDNNISLYDYDEATSAYEDAYINFDMNLSRDRDDDQAAYNARINIDAERVLSSPSRDIDIDFNGTGNVGRSGTANANSTNNYAFNTSITADNYFRPGSKAGFWFGSLGIKGDDSFDDLDTRLSVGLGYGRVTNVTPMAKAIRLVQELRARGAIAAAPSKSIYRSIADIIARKSEYQSKYGGKAKFYQQHWVGDIEKALGTSLNAAGILGARDVLLDENISIRKYGWKVRAGLSYVGTDFSGLKNNPGILLGAEYHVPVSNQLQFSNEAAITTTFDDKNNYDFNNNMRVTYEVDDRVDWINDWTLNYNHSAIDSDDVTTNTLSSTFAYEIGNSLDLTLTGLVKNSSGNDIISAGERADGTDRSVNFGIRYRLR